MLGTAHPRHLGAHQRAVLHRVQMPPHPRPPVVPRTGRPAGRADQRFAHELYAYFDVTLLKGQPHVVHPPRALDTQQSFVEGRLSHPASVPSGRMNPCGHNQL